MAERPTKRTVQLDILTTGFRVAEQDLTKLGQQIKRVGDEAKKGGLAGSLGGLNRSFMGAGITGDAGLVGLMRGAGAGAAVMFGADILGGVARAFIDVRDNSRDMAEALREAANSIPILGNIFQAGGAIREAFLGEKAQLKLAEEVGKLIEAQVKDSREVNERMKQLVEGERGKLNSMFGEKGSAAEAARRQFDDELSDVELKFMGMLRAIAAKITEIETTRLNRENWVRRFNLGLMMDTGFTEEERRALDSLEQERRLLQEQRDQLRPQMRELGDFAALRGGQREQLEDFKRRLQRAGRDRGRPYELPDFGDVADRFGTGVQAEARERMASAMDRQSKEIADLVKEVKQLVNVLEKDRDQGFITELQRLLDEALEQ